MRRSTRDTIHNASTSSTAAVAMAAAMTTCLVYSLERARTSLYPIMMMRGAPRACARRNAISMPCRPRGRRWISPA
jgi:hypothetical protein